MKRKSEKQDVNIIEKMKSESNRNLYFIFSSRSNSASPVSRVLLNFFLIFLHSFSPRTASYVLSRNNVRLANWKKLYLSPAFYPTLGVYYRCPGRTLGQFEPLHPSTLYLQVTFGSTISKQLVRLLISYFVVVSRTGNLTGTGNLTHRCLSNFI